MPDLTPEQCENLERLIEGTEDEIRRLLRLLPGTTGAERETLKQRIDDRRPDLLLYQEDYAYGGCGISPPPPPAPPPKVRIVTFEATQAIQTANNESDLVMWDAVTKVTAEEREEKGSRFSGSPEETAGEVKEASATKRGRGASTVFAGARAVPNGGAEPHAPFRHQTPRRTLSRPLAPFSVGCIDMVPLAETLRSDRGADTVRDVDAYLRVQPQSGGHLPGRPPGSARCPAGQR